MITEDYVSFETAKLLKEKGFNEPCIATYNSVTKNFEVEEVYQDWTTRWKAYISAPTLQMAMKWLREVHNISIEAVYDCSNGKTETISWWFANIKHINPGSSKENDCLTAYDSYEEACEAAIKYCLQNLI